MAIGVYSWDEIGALLDALELAAGVGTGQTSADYQAGFSACLNAVRAAYVEPNSPEALIVISPIEPPGEYRPFQPPGVWTCWERQKLMERGWENVPE